MNRKLVLIGIVAVGLLAACEGGYSTGEIVMNGDFKAVGNKGSYDVLRDTSTGCLYLEPHSSRGLAPLYDEDGNVKGCGEKVSDEF
jgi:hypothetical protein